MNRRVTPLGILATAVALAAVAWLAAAGKPGTASARKDKQNTADAAEAVRDVFLLLDHGPLHLRLRITIAGKSPQAARREYLARLFQALDTNKDGKLNRAEFERSP